MKRREIRIMQTDEAQIILSALFDPEDDYGAFPTEMTFETIPEWEYLEREEELKDFYNEEWEVI